MTRSSRSAWASALSTRSTLRREPSGKRTHAIHRRFASFHRTVALDHRSSSNAALDAAITAYSGMAQLALGDHRKAVRELRGAIDQAAGVGNRIAESVPVALSMLAARALTSDIDDDPAELLELALERSVRSMWAVSRCGCRRRGIAHLLATRGAIDDAGRLVGFLDEHDPGRYQPLADLRRLVPRTPRG